MLKSLVLQNILGTMNRWNLITRFNLAKKLTEFKKFTDSIGWKIFNDFICDRISSSFDRFAALSSKTSIWDYGACSVKGILYLLLEWNILERWSNIISFIITERIIHVLVFTFDEFLFNSFTTGRIASVHNLHWTLPNKLYAAIMPSSKIFRFSFSSSIPSTFSIESSKLLENDEPWWQNTIKKLVINLMFLRSKFNFKKTFATN